MDIFVHRQKFDTQQPNGVSTNLKIFNRVLHWLAGFIRLTEKEQEDAGSYLGNQYSREYPPDATIVKNSSHSNN
jgi:hypothetical protein